MKIDQLDTPFLYLDEDGDDEAALIHPAYLETHVPTAKQTGAPRPHKMQVKELQDALGVVEMDADGCAILERPKWGRTKEFEAQRQVHSHSPRCLDEAGTQPAPSKRAASTAKPAYQNSTFQLVAGAVQGRGQSCRARQGAAGYAGSNTATRVASQPAEALERNRHPDSLFA